LSGTREETALQRRVARMARLTLLVRREALLHDFLIAANTETPVLRDDATHALAPGVAISSTIVTLDFIGSPIIRARVRSLLATAQALELVAEIVDAGGGRGRAATTLTLQPGETRIVELLCPEKLSPASLIWSTVPL
jgi:hypothetical protein